MPLPARPPVSPPAQPAPPVAPPAPAQGFGEAPTANRGTIGDGVGINRSGVILPPAPAASGEIDVGKPAPPAPEPPARSVGASKPNAPAPTVMFESQIHSRPPTLEEQNMGAASLPAASPPLPDPLPPEPSPPPTVSKHKGKGKQPPRKVFKPKSSLTSKRGEDEEQTEAKPPSSKTGIIIFFILLAIGILIVTVVILRGGKSKQDAPSTETSTEKSKPLFEPKADEPKPTFAPKEPPPAPKPAPEKPARPAKPTPAPTVAKPRPEPTPAEPSRPSDDDIRRASEAYQRGNAKLFAGNIPEAIAEFALALRLNPKEPVHHRALGLAHEKAGHTREATKYLKAYLKAAPKANDRAMVEKHLNQLRGR